MVADSNDPNSYEKKYEREKQTITEQNDNGEYRVPREEDRKDLRLYANTVTDRVDYSCAFNYLGRLRRLAEILDKPLQDCDVDDINLGMADLAEKNLGEGKSYSDGTRRQYLRTVEDFGQARDVDALTQIDVPSVSQDKIDEDWCLDKSEVWELIEAADNTRTKAAIAICWECAWRATALMSLKVGDYEDVNDEYALLSAPHGVTGDKGAGGDKKPVTIARGYVDNWLQDHPCSDDDDAALICRTDKSRHYGEHMSSEAVRLKLNQAAEEAGIDKDRVHVHCFRHARVTFMKKSSEYSDMDIEHTLDWSAGSNQMKRYSHVDQTDKIASVLRARGIEAEEGSVDPEFSDCPRCGQQIPYDARNCPYCTVRVSEKPADWFKLYRKVLIDTENDAVVSKYDGMSSATPSLPRLPKPEFERVNEVFEAVLAIQVLDTQVSTAYENASDEQDVLTEALEERIEEVDASVLTDEELERVLELASDPETRLENVDLHEVGYELTPNTTQQSGGELRDRLTDEADGDGE